MTTPIVPRPSGPVPLRALASALRRGVTARFAGRAGQPAATSDGSLVPDDPETMLRPRTLKLAQEFVRYFVELCDLRAGEAVLDVGSGEGGVAVQLTKYLDRSGRYEGLDIRGHEIERCSRAITPRYPHFRFRVADVHNTLYNPKGRFKASEYRFPYDDASFDFVCLISVFTHMGTDEIDNYLREIARVMRPGGRCLITHFLINPEAARLIASGRSRKRFAHDFGTFRAEDGDVPERAIAVEETVVRSLYARHGLTIREPIRYGGWSGRRPFLSRQDVVIATRD
jgi:ubiquinone/menaquinone biosynthesis C-methylase UbiE